MREDMYRARQHDVAAYPMVVRSFMSGHLPQLFDADLLRYDSVLSSCAFFWIFRSTSIDWYDHARPHTTIIFLFLAGPDRKGKIKRAQFQLKSHEYLIADVNLTLQSLLDSNNFCAYPYGSCSVICECL